MTLQKSLFQWTRTLSLSLVAALSLSIPVWAQPASPASAQEKVQGEKTRRHKKDMGGPLMGWFGKDLNLSDAQKAEFKALMADMKGQRPAGQREAHQKMMQTLKQAFLSNNFDAVAVRAQLQGLQAPNQRSEKMAQALVKGWKILTPEQRAKAQTHMAQMEERMQKRAAKPREARPDKPMGKLFGELNLTEAQQQQFKALMVSQAPDMNAKLQKARQLKQSVLAELNGKADAAKIAAFLASMQPDMQQGMAKHIDMMAKAHAILTPAQRQQLVTQMEQRGQQWRQHHRGGKRPAAKAEQG